MRCHVKTSVIGRSAVRFREVIPQDDDAFRNHDYGNSASSKTSAAGKPGADQGLGFPCRIL
jgi:hypothetical protein